MISYPISVSPVGGLTLSTDPERDKILAILKTRYWERCMIPSFGTIDPTFDPVDANSLGDLILGLQIALDYWIGDGITVEGIPIDPETGTVQILIRYGNGTGQILWDINTEILRSGSIR